MTNPLSNSPVPFPLPPDATPRERHVHECQTAIAVQRKRASECPRHEFERKPGFVSVCRLCGTGVLPSIAAWYELGLAHALPVNDFAAIAEAKRDYKLFGAGFIQVKGDSLERLPPLSVFIKTP